MAENRQPSLAQVLRRARMAVGLSQRELSRESGIAERTISDIERGVAVAPRSATLRLLADALRLDPDTRQHLIEAARGPGTAIGRPPRIRADRTRPSARQRSPHRPRLEAEHAILGRDRLFHHLWPLVHDGGLVTLTGPGGIGKSRLALAVAEDLAADGGLVHVITLDIDGTAGNVLSRIVDSVAIEGTIASVEAIARAIAETDRPTLLLLDNADHVTDLGEVLAEIAAGAPNLSILITRRAPLDVPDEHIVPVPPLDLPAADPLTGRPARTGLLENAAVQLFLQRAPIHLDDNDLSSVAAIVSMLDGIPLAIELAAAQCTYLSPSAIAAILEARGYALLSSRDRHAESASRQRSMDDVVAWSVEHLSMEARRLLATLSAFAGGFTMDAVLHVLERSGESALVDAFPEVIRHGLVHEAEVPGRFTMLEPIRWYAGRLLKEQGREPFVARAHAQWVAQWARRVRHEVTSLYLDEALRTERAERSNALLAVRRSVDLEDWDTAATIVVSLFRLWESAALHGTIGRNLLQIADHAADLASRDDRRDILFDASYFHASQRQPVAARERIAQIRHICADDPVAEGFAILAESVMYTIVDPTMVDRLLEADRLLAAAGHPQHWMIRLRLGVELLFAHRAAEALPVLQQTLEEVELAGDLYDLPPVLWQLAFAEMELDLLDDARATLCRDLRICRDHGFTLAGVQALVGLADCCTRDPRRDLAEIGLALAVATHRFYDQMGLPYEVEWDERVTAARALALDRFGAEVVLQAESDGATWSLVEATDLALNTAESR